MVLVVFMSCSIVMLTDNEQVILPAHLSQAFSPPVAGLAPRPPAPAPGLLPHHHLPLAGARLGRPVSALRVWRCAQPPSRKLGEVRLSGGFSSGASWTALFSDWTAWAAHRHLGRELDAAIFLPIQSPAGSCVIHSHEEDVQVWRWCGGAR